MSDCRTCALLGTPANAEHAAHYRECRWQPEAFPANVLHLEAVALQRPPARWITVKVLQEQPEKLRPCPAWKGGADE